MNKKKEHASLIKRDSLVNKIFNYLNFSIFFNIIKGFFFGTKSDIYFKILFYFLTKLFVFRDWRNSSLKISSLKFLIQVYFLKQNIKKLFDLKKIEKFNQNYSSKIETSTKQYSIYHSISKLGVYLIQENTFDFQEIG